MFFDSAIFGYGLTLGIFNRINNNEVDLPYYDYLDFNIFIKDFIEKPTHSKLWRDFSKLFDINTEYEIKNRILIKEKLKLRYEEMFEYGFERWVSKYLFDPKKCIDKDTIIFIYLLYNYWADILWKNVWCRKSIQNKLEKISNNIISKVSSDNIFTTNYDIFLNKYISQKHIHGKFMLPLKKLKDFITLDPLNSNAFEYSYLFGCGALEKDIRLNNIKKIGIDMAYTG